MLNITILKPEKLDKKIASKIIKYDQKSKFKICV